MKLPSLQYLASHATHAFLRFPLTIVSSLVAVVVSIYMIEYREEIKNIFPLINVSLVAALGIPFYFCVTVFAEKKKIGQKNLWLLRFLASFALLALYFTLPGSEDTQNTSLPYIRYGIYNVTIHLLVSFVPFLTKGQMNGFWQYNRILFIRFLTAILYSGFLFVGLVLALFALKLLFDVKIPDELYFEMFIVIGGFFNTWFFVAGIPEDFDALEDLHAYPKGLKIFSQFILLPLLILYLVILYGYGIKIVALWDWPKGMVAYLITCVSVLGMFTLLFIFPYSKMEGNSWIKQFSRIYYYVLIPLVILLFIAISMRLSDYGITINRYAIFALGVWLSIVCLYFISGRNNIKFIPISLAVVLVIISFGPWSIFSVSERSQVNRLKTILQKAQILEGEKVMGEVYWIPDSLPNLQPANLVSNEGLMADSLHNEVKSILDYLDNHHGFSSIQGWYQQDLDAIITKNHTQKDRWERLGEAEVYMRSLGLKYQYKYKNTNDSYFSFYAKLPNAVPVKGFDYLFSFDFYGPHSVRNNGENTEIIVNEDVYRFYYSFLSHDPILLIGEKDTITLPVNEIVEEVYSKYSAGSNSKIPAAEMRVTASSEKVYVKLEIKNFSTNNVGDSMSVSSVAGNIFLKVKQ